MPMLAGASGQLRNMATTGGNLLQRTRCAYFADPTHAVHQALGPTRPARRAEGWARYHAILGASERLHRHAPVGHGGGAAVLDARVQVLGPDGERTIDIGELHRLPGDDPTRDTVLGHGELITAVDLPASPIAAGSTYRKVRDRASYAFALVSVAAALDVENGVVADVRDRARRGRAQAVARDPRRGGAARRAPPPTNVPGRRGRRARRRRPPVETPLGGNAFKIPLVTATVVDTPAAARRVRPGGSMTVIDARAMGTSLRRIEGPTRSPAPRTTPPRPPSTTPLHLRAGAVDDRAAAP